MRGTNIIPADAGGVKREVDLCRRIGYHDICCKHHDITEHPALKRWSPVGAGPAPEDNKEYAGQRRGWRWAILCLRSRQSLYQRPGFPIRVKPCERAGASPAPTGGPAFQSRILNSSPAQAGACPSEALGFSPGNSHATILKTIKPTKMVY